MGWLIVDPKTGAVVATVSDTDPEKGHKLFHYQEQGYRTVYTPEDTGTSEYTREPNNDNIVYVDATIKETENGLTISGLTAEDVERVIEENNLDPSTVRVEKTSEGYVITGVPRQQATEEQAVKEGEQAGEQEAESGEYVTKAGDKYVHGAVDTSIPDWQRFKIAVHNLRNKIRVENKKSSQTEYNAFLAQTTRYLYLEGQLRQEAMDNAIQAQMSRWLFLERNSQKELSPNEWLARAWSAYNTESFYNPPPPMSPSEYLYLKAKTSNSAIKQVGYGLLSGVAGTLEGFLNPAMVAYSYYDLARTLKNKEKRQLLKTELLTPYGLATLTGSLFATGELWALSRLPRPTLGSITITTGVRRTSTSYLYSRSFVEPPSDIQRLGNKVFQDMIGAKCGGAIHDSFALRDEYAVARYVENAYGASLGATPAGAAGARARPATPQLLEVEPPRPRGGAGAVTAVSGRQRLMLLPLEESRPVFFTQKLYYIDWSKGPSIILPPKPPSTAPREPTIIDALLTPAPSKSKTPSTPQEALTPTKTSIIQPKTIHPSIINIKTRTRSRLKQDTMLKPLSLIKSPSTTLVETPEPLIAPPLLDTKNATTTMQRQRTKQTSATRVKNDITSTTEPKHTPKIREESLTKVFQVRAGRPASTRVKVKTLPALNIRLTTAPNISNHLLTTKVTRTTRGQRRTKRVAQRKKNRKPKRSKRRGPEKWFYGTRVNPFNLDLF